MARLIQIFLLLAVLFLKPANSIDYPVIENVAGVSGSVVLVQNLAKVMTVHTKILHITHCCDPNKSETFSSVGQKACEFEIYVLTRIGAKLAIPRWKISECKGVLAELDKTGRRKSTLNELQINFSNSQGAIEDSPRFGSEKSWSRAFAHVTDETKESAESTTDVHEINVDFTSSVNENTTELWNQIPESFNEIPASDLESYSKSIQLLLELQKTCGKNPLPSRISEMYGSVLKIELEQNKRFDQWNKFNFTIHNTSCFTTVENFRVLMNVSIQDVFHPNSLLLPKRLLPASFTVLIAIIIVVLLIIVLCNQKYKTWTKAHEEILI